MNLERFEFVKDGAIKLPPGFRFQPTDEEVVFQYLLRKTFSWPLPASVIPVLNVDCKHLDPWDLPGDDEQDRYFFTNSKEVMKYRRNGSNRNNYRTTQTGYWKPTGIDKQIFNNNNSNNSNASSRKKPIIGKRKTLVFYKGNSPHGTRTQWIMHEYHLLFSRNDGIFTPNHQISSGTIQIGHWVICHIFMKKSRRSRSRSKGSYAVAGTFEKWRRDCEFGVERVDEHEYRYIIEQQDSTSTSLCGGGDSVASSDDLSVVTADEQLSSNCN